MNKALATAFLAVLGLCLTPAAHACPACNIHNYLASSVQSSDNVFLGKVLKQIDDRTAQVKVLKVLHGNHQVGEIVKTEMWQPNDHIDETFIFSDPDAWPPTFEVLLPAFENEIVFLLQKEPAVNTIDQAITRVQGVSTVTQRIGMAYLADNHAKAVDPLINAISELMPDVFASDDVFFGEHRLGKLVQALLRNESKPVEQFVLNYIDGLSNQAPRKIDWQEIPRYASSQAVFLRDLLRHSEDQEELHQTLCERLIKQLPALSGAELADAVYALVLLDPAMLGAIQSALEDTEETNNSIALGLHYAARYKSGWWSHDAAYAYWDQAIAIAQNPELKQTIQEAIAHNEKRFERKKQ